MDEFKASFLKKNSQLVKSVLMNLMTPYEVLCWTLCASWVSKKEDNKGYSFNFFYGLLIRAHEKLLDEGKLEVKHHAHLLKGKHQHTIEKEVKLEIKRKIEIASTKILRRGMTIKLRLRKERIRPIIIAKISDIWRRIANIRLNT
jgi:hypothetical protein